MFLSKIYKEAGEEADMAFIYSLFGAVALAGAFAAIVVVPDILNKILASGLASTLVFAAICFAGDDDGHILKTRWLNVLSFFVAMSLCFLGLGFGLFNGLYSGFYSEGGWYWIPFIIIIEEIFYFADDAQLPVRANKYLFTVTKKLEAFFEVSLVFGGIGFVFFLTTEASGILPALEDIGIVTGAALLIAGFIWVNSLKWKKPALPTGNFE